MGISINLLVFLIIIAGTVVLQIFLSKSRRKWPGLILPIIFFMISILGVMSVATFSTITHTEQTVLENGEPAERIVSQNTVATDIPAVIFTIIYVFVLYNIPTVIFIAIYFSCREKMKKNKEIDKMNIQDLE